MEAQQNVLDIYQSLLINNKLMNKALQIYLTTQCQKFFKIIIFFVKISMVERIEYIKKQFVPDASKYMHFLDLVPANELPIIQKVKDWCQHHVNTRQMEQAVQNAHFPEFLLPSLKKLDIMKYFIDKPYGQPISMVGQGMILATVASFDASVSTFIMLHAPLTAYTINLLGSQQQKEKYLKSMVKLDIVGGWALTQEKVGSNATQIQTNISQQNGSLILNGDKRWIGNGNRDIVVVWARDLQTKQVNGVIVEKDNKGVKRQIINHKLGLRPVQNCILRFNHTVLPLSSKLPKATKFSNGPGKILLHSRVSVCWIAAGVCMGVYNKIIQYSSNRKQFNKPITSFQLVTEKIVKIMAMVQSILLYCWKITKLEMDKKLTAGQVSMCKAWVTDRGRIICQLGRQIMGGNGILHDNYVMKALADMEVLYTYEGTYDINALVCGRQLTGQNAIK